VRHARRLIDGQNADWGGVRDLVNINFHHCGDLGDKLEMFPVQFMTLATHGWRELPQSKSSKHRPWAALLSRLAVQAMRQVRRVASQVWGWPGGCLWHD